MTRARMMPPPAANREPQSVSILLPRVLDRDPDAIRTLWDRFFPRLVALARSRLGPNLRQPVDGEDVALKAFAEFIRLMWQPDAATRFPVMQNRDHLWRVLARITVWEAHDWLRPTTWPAEGGDEGLDQIPGRDPDPALTLAIHDEVEELIGSLHGRDAAQTDRLRKLARLKMQGRTNPEAARELGCCVAQVELLLRHIRETWHDRDPRPRTDATPRGE